MGVKNRELDRLASIIVCESANFLFTYIGLPIGANTKLASNWRPVVEKFYIKIVESEKQTPFPLVGDLHLLSSVWVVTLYFTCPYSSIRRRSLIYWRELEANFFGEAKEIIEKIHWVAWSMLV